MRRFTIFLVTLLSLLIFPEISKASPMYYTFEGNIVDIDDNAGIAAEQGLGLGSLVDFTFILDFDAAGYLTWNDSTVIYLPDAPPYTDFFYSDFVSGSILPEKNGGYSNGPHDTAEYNFGSAEMSLGVVDNKLFGGSDDSVIAIESSSTWPDDISDWVVGTEVYGYTSAKDSSGKYSQYYANLSVTSITPVTQTPEPSTLLLLGGGIGGFVLIRRRLRNR